MEVDGINLAIGGGAVTAIAGVIGAWIRARFSKTTVEPTPLPVTTEKTPKYVTVQEFNKHVEDNARDHENIFSRLSANEKLASRFEGLLEGIREDLKAIKDKLFRRTK